MRPHGFRKVSSELAHRAAVVLKAKHPGVYDHLTPEHFSRALLGHTLRQTIADVYRSLYRERLTSLTVDEAWAIVRAGSEGSRGGTDGESCDDKTLRRIADLATEIESLEAQDATLAAFAARAEDAVATHLHNERAAISTQRAARARELASLAVQLRQSGDQIESGG